MPSRIRVSAARAGRSVSQAVVSQWVLTSGGFRVDLSGCTLMRQSTLSQSFTKFLHEG